MISHRCAVQLNWALAVVELCQVDRGLPVYALLIRCG